MVRVKIDLTDEEYNATRRESEILGISIEELIRRLLQCSLFEASSKPWMRFAGMVESGDAKSSQEINSIP